MSYPAISAYNLFREDSRCVLILEKLALRGTFWPSSCAAVTGELQSAFSTQTSGRFLVGIKINFLGGGFGNTHNANQPRRNQYTTNPARQSPIP